MSEVEHYFENLIHNGKDISSNANKDFLSKEVQEAVEECALYIKSLLGLGIITYTENQSKQVPVDDLISREVLRKAMYHEAFEMDSDEQRWDSGCWIRYKMFERVLKEQPSIEIE